jgi:hypothetical protein
VTIDGADEVDPERGGARRFHVDVMDGLFVPNISSGASMVVDEFAEAGAMTSTMAPNARGPAAADAGHPEGHARLR